jgi:hypothetical protein
VEDAVTAEAFDAKWLLAEAEVLERVKAVRAAPGA